MVSKRKITFVVRENFPHRIDEYECVEVVNSTAYRPGTVYGKDDVDRLCGKGNWTVIVRGAK